MNWPDPRLQDLFGIAHPILQSPMAGTATPALAAEVSNAGGLGALGCAEMSEAALRASVAELRARTDQPFNLNFFVYPAPHTDAATLARTRARLQPWYDRLGLGEVPATLPALPAGFDDAKLRLLLEIAPKVASFHFGPPPPHAVRALRSAGITLLATATCTAEARSLELAGVDAVIAQGHDAGGHRGSHHAGAPGDGVGTMALVPQVVDAVRLPVIAAGGIGDGRGVVAALALGAAGVQMGTAFLRCPEAATPAARRALLRHARDTDTMMSDAFSGRTARTRRSAYAVDMADNRTGLPAFPSLYGLTDPLLGADRPDEACFDLWGQAASLSRDESAAAVMTRVVAEAQAALTRLQPG